MTQRWRPIRSTVGVVGLVQSGDAPVPVAPEVIETLKRREQDGADLLPARELRTGDAVRVTEGPLQYLIGRLLSVPEHERVFILPDFLGRGVRAEVPAAAVKAA